MAQLRHPWHPIFVHFPITCWILALVVEVLFYALPEFRMPGEMHPGAFAVLLLWIGNATAVIAMGVGLVDMAKLPENREVMSTVYKHMAWMTSAWGLMLGAALLRTADRNWAEPPGWLSLALELAALACLIAGGLQASRLVYHLHLGNYSGD